jgi:hypothetical protein
MILGGASVDGPALPAASTYKPERDCDPDHFDSFLPRNGRRSPVRGYRRRDESNVGQAEMLARLFGEGQAAMVNGVECSAENSNGRHALMLPALA